VAASRSPALRVVIEVARPNMRVGGGTSSEIPTKARPAPTPIKTLDRKGKFWDATAAPQRGSVEAFVEPAPRGARNLAGQ